MAVDQQTKIDELIAARKTMSGRPVWARTAYVGQHRWLTALDVDGEGTGLNLVVDAWPSSPSLRFTITLNYGRCVSRFDGWENDRHNNHPVRGQVTPVGIDMGWLFGPHCHLWNVNRHLCHNGNLPDTLEFAIRPPLNVQGFENSFRWFCGAVNIVCGNNECPTLPPRETLL